MLDDGSPVLFVSRLAEHARNLERDPSASLMVAEPESERDPLAAGRVTLAGEAHRPDGNQARVAEDAYVAAVPSAQAFREYRDFSVWVLSVDRVRWVGGFGRMASVDGASYSSAVPDPVAPAAAGAIKHLNADHADALLDMTRSLGGHPDATASACVAIDRYGLDLEAVTPRGAALCRIAFAATVSEPAGLRPATVELARRARESL